MSFSVSFWTIAIALLVNVFNAGMAEKKHMFCYAVCIPLLCIAAHAKCQDAINGIWLVLQSALEINQKLYQCALNRKILIDTECPWKSVCVSFGAWLVRPHHHRHQLKCIMKKIKRLMLFYFHTRWDFQVHDWEKLFVWRSCERDTSRQLLGNANCKESNEKAAMKCPPHSQYILGPNPITSKS